MEAGSWDGDSAACSSLEAGLGLAAWMLVARMLGIGLHGSRGPIRSLQSWNLQNLMTEPGGLQAWRLAAWMVILQPAAAWKLGWGWQLGC